uniref:Uncharacterized protein n=1 Tax=Rhizophora mucronata TaxID=61149 RepID=A0A2P2JAK8_RHIMU
MSSIICTSIELFAWNVMLFDVHGMNKINVTRMRVVNQNEVWAGMDFSLSIFFPFSPCALFSNLTPYCAGWSPPTVF